MKNIGAEKTVQTRFPLSDAGWGFNVVWGLAVVFTPVLSGSDVNMGIFWLTSMIGTPLGLLAFFMLPFKLETYRAKEIAVIFAVGVMTLGIVLLKVPISPVSGVESQFMQGLGGFVSGLGSSVFTVLWGGHYASLAMPRIERMATASLILAFLCYLVVLVVPQGVGIILVGCFPFLSAACLIMAKKDSEIESLIVAPEDLRSLGNLSIKGFVRLGLGIIGATSVVSLFWSFITEGLIPVPAGVLTASVLSGLLVAVVIEAYVTRFARALNLGMLYRWVLPLIAVAFSLLLFSNTPMLVGAVFLVNAAQALLNLTTFVYFAELSQRSGASPLRVFGLGRFFLESGFLIGLLLMPVARQLIAEIGFYQGVLFLFLTAFIILAMISIANQDKMAFTFEDVTGVEGAAQRSAGAVSGHPEGSKPITLSTQAQFEAACLAASDTFGLTKREREILPYLAQGYSLPYIRNELYISQSTIDTHVRHIYKKMGIHSKEELITYMRGQC